jgi:dsDNA-binding SOS-regulon protein
MACVSLLPKQAQKVESPFTDISDAELEALETHLAAVRAKMVQTIDGTATDAPATTPQPHKTASEDAEKDTAASILDRAQRNVDDAA